MIATKDKNYFCNIFQVVASFYMLLVILLVGTNLGMSRRRRKKTSMDKRYALQFKEGEGVKCTVVDEKIKTEEDGALIEDL